MNRVLLIVGNGLSIDLYNYLGLTINPCSPFLFDLPNPFDVNSKLLDSLTRVKNMICSQSNVKDFDIIQSFIKNYRKDNSEEQWKHCELRHYLSLAYSYANNIILSQWKSAWLWEVWMRRNYNKLAGIVSFNYDLTVETTLDKLFLRYYRINSSEDQSGQGVPVFKPHGSCDFDISSKAISMPTQLRFKNLTFLNNYIVGKKGRVEVISKDRLLEPRIEADIVLPFEFSPQTQLTWVKQGYQMVSQIAKTIDYCVIVGLSYQDCDRLEIDSIIDCMHLNTEILLVDSNPHDVFVKKLKKISGRTKIMTSKDLWWEMVDKASK